MIFRDLPSERLLGHWEEWGDDTASFFDGRGVKVAEVVKLRQVHLVDLWVFRLLTKRFSGVVKGREAAKEMVEKLLKEGKRT